MRGLAEKPQVVKAAAEAQKGMFLVWEILIFVAVFVVASLAMVPVQLLTVFATSLDGYMFIVLCSEILMIVVFCLFCKLIQKRKMSTLGFCKKGMVKEYLIGSLAGFVVFALLHLANDGLSVLAVVNLTLFGIFASMYFVRRGNIWGIAAFHSIWNWIQGNFYGVKVSGIDMSNSLFTTHTGRSADWLSGGDFGLEGSIFVTIVFVIGIVILYKMKPAAQAVGNGEE